MRLPFGKKKRKKVIDVALLIILLKREKRDRHLHFVRRGRGSTISIRIMATELTLSCDSDKTETGPTLIHSTGVEHYKIPPELVGIINQSNDSSIYLLNKKYFLDFAVMISR